MTINKHTTAFLAQPAAIEELDEEEKKDVFATKKEEKKKVKENCSAHEQCFVNKGNTIYQEMPSYFTTCYTEHCNLLHF